MTKTLEGREAWVHVLLLFFNFHSHLKNCEREVGDETQFSSFGAGIGEKVRASFRVPCAGSYVAPTNVEQKPASCWYAHNVSLSEKNTAELVSNLMMLTMRGKIMKALSGKKHLFLGNERTSCVVQHFPQFLPAPCSFWELLIGAALIFDIPLLVCPKNKTDLVHFGLCILFLCSAALFWNVLPTMHLV